MPTKVASPEEDLVQRRKSAVKEELEELTLAFIGALNASDWAFTSPSAAKFLDRVDENFKLKREDRRSSLDWTEAVELWELTASRIPDYHQEVVNITSVVGRDNSYSAAVHTQTDVAGVNGLKFLWTMEVRWRLNKQTMKWMCFEMSGMRGTAYHKWFV